MPVETAIRDGIYIKQFIHLMQFVPFGIKRSCILLKAKIMKYKREETGCMVAM
jgi:hypothetical protein